MVTAGGRTPALGVDVKFTWACRLRLIVRVICRWLHTPSFATVSPHEVSGSSPAEVQNFGKDSVCEIFSSSKPMLMFSS